MSSQQIRHPGLHTAKRKGQGENRPGFHSGKTEVWKQGCYWGARGQSRRTPAIRENSQVRWVKERESGGGGVERGGEGRTNLKGRPGLETQAKLPLVPPQHSACADGQEKEGVERKVSWLTDKTITSN